MDNSVPQAWWENDVLHTVREEALQNRAVQSHGRVVFFNVRVPISVLLFSYDDRCILRSWNSSFVCFRYIQLLYLGAWCLHDILYIVRRRLGTSTRIDSSSLRGTRPCCSITFHPGYWTYSLKILDWEIMGMVQRAMHGFIYYHHLKQKRETLLTLPY